MFSSSFPVIMRTEPGVYFYVQFRKPSCGLYVSASLNFSFFFLSLCSSLYACYCFIWKLRHMKIEWTCVSFATAYLNFLLLKKIVNISKFIRLKVLVTWPMSASNYKCNAYEFLHMEALYFNLFGRKKKCPPGLHNFLEMRSFFFVWRTGTTLCMWMATLFIVSGWVETLFYVRNIIKFSQQIAVLQNCKSFGFTGLIGIGPTIVLRDDASTTPTYVFQALCESHTFQ